MSFVRFGRLTCFLLFGLAVGGCVTTASSPNGSSSGGVPLDQIQIQDRFEVVNVDASSLGREAHRCVPQLAANAKSVTDTAAKLPLPRGNTVALSHLNGSSWLVISGATAICIPRSAAGYPIFASEAFVATVNPSGVPPTITDGWYAQLARRLAEKGRVSAAYIFSNGNATIATYWVEPASKNFLYYASEFKKAGTWESGTYDFRFTDPNMSSVASVKRGSASIKVNLIEHR